MATSLLPRPVGGAAAALSTQASPSRVFVSLPLPSADPLLSVSSVLPHLSRSGPSFQKIQRGLWLAQGPGKPRDLRLFLAATLHLRKWSPSPFPKASRESEVSSEDHLVETGDSLIRRIQAGSTSHSSGGESQEQRLTRQGPGGLAEAEAGPRAEPGGERPGNPLVGPSSAGFLPALFHCPTPAGRGSGHGGLGKRDVNGSDGRDGRRGLLTANCPLWLRL